MNTEFLQQPKVDKPKRIPIIIAIVVVCILAIGGGVYAYVSNTPEAKVLKGIKATSEELEKNKSTFEKIVGDDYEKTLKDKGVNENMTFALKSSNMPELSAYNGSGISLDYSYDENNKKLLFDLGGQYKGTNIGDAKFYTDNNKLMISVPQLYDAWFTCDADNIQKQYNNSVFATSKKMSTKEISIKVFDDEKALQGKELTDAIIKGYLAQNADKLANVGKNIKIQKSKQTKSIEIGGTSQECTGYDVVITGQDAKDLINSAADYMLQDPEIRKTITASAKYSYMQQVNKNYNTPEDMVNDIYSEMKDSVAKFEKSVDCNDINAVIYLDKKGRAVGLDLDTEVTANSKKIDVKLSSDLKGGDNLGNAMDMSVEFDSNGKSILNVNFDNTTTTKDDSVNQEANLAFDYNKESVNFKENITYNNKSGDFTGSIDGDSQGEGFNVSTAGNLKFDKSSSKLQLDFDKIDLKSNLRNTSNVNISLEGSFAIAPLDNSIEEPTGEKLEVFKLSENKAYEIIQEVQNNATKVVSALK